MAAAYFIIGLILGMGISILGMILLFIANRQPPLIEKIDPIESHSRKYHVVGYW